MRFFLFSSLLARGWTTYWGLTKLIIQGAHSFVESPERDFRVVVCSSSSAEMIESCAAQDFMMRQDDGGCRLIMMLNHREISIVE
jgi:hypothetical protein